MSPSDMQRIFRFRFLFGPGLAMLSCGAAIVALILMCTGDLAAQTTFQKIYGSTSSDACNDLAITADSGYVMVGYTMNIGAGSQDASLMKLDKAGNLQWAKNYGGVTQDVANSVALAQDGGYLIAGYTNSFGSGYDDIYLIRTDSLGGMVWSRAYGSVGSERCHDVAATGDGGFVAVGGTYGFGAGSSDAYLLKVAANGDQEFLKTYGGAGYEEAFSVIETGDGGFAFTGGTASFGAGGEDIYLVRTDDKGDPVWSRAYGGDAWDRASSVKQTDDGGFIIAGFTQSFDLQKHYDLKCYLLKVDTFGVPQWSKAFGKYFSENVAYDVIQSSEGGYCVAGYSGYFTGDYSAYIVKTDPVGTPVWSKVEGAGALNAFQTVAQTYDGGYVMGGYTNGFGNLNELWLVRADSFGMNKCNTADSIILFHDTLPMAMQPADLVTTGNFADTSAGVETNVNLDETLLCSNLCNIVADFSIPDSIFCTGDTITLHSSSIGAESLSWYLDDQLYAVASDTIYIADSLGTFSISLVADSLYCSDSSSFNITIADTVISDFTYSVANLTVSFFESALYENSVLWYFESGATATSSAPEYTYADTGIYTVCLVAVNSCSTDSTCHDVEVNCPYPVIAYTAVSDGLSVSFSNNTTLADTYYWIFGDGNASNVANAQHTYVNPGTYEVCLIATNACGSVDSCKNIVVVEDTLALAKNIEWGAYIDFRREAMELSVSLGSGIGCEAIVIYNATGQNTGIGCDCPPGKTTFTLNTGKLADGVYFVAVNGTRWIYSEKFLVTR